VLELNLSALWVAALYRLATPLSLLALFQVNIVKVVIPDGRLTISKRALSHVNCLADTAMRATALNTSRSSITQLCTNEEILAMSADVSVNTVQPQAKVDDTAQVCRAVRLRALFPGVFQVSEDLIDVVACC